MAEQRDVVIIGAGVIGVCCAYFLSEAGARVCVIDKGAICSGASYGNAGLLTPSHAIPVTAPGTIVKGLRWLFDRSSPFYIKPRPSLELMSWLWRFYRSANWRDVERAMPVLHQLGRRSVELFDEIIQKEKIECHFELGGWLQAYTTEAGLRDGVHEAEVVAPVGVESRRIGREELASFEPALSDEVIGGVYYPGDGKLEPGLFVTEVARILESRGVEFHTDCDVLDLDLSNDSRCTVKTGAGDYDADTVVLAAGYLSPDFAARLCLNIPIQPAKGYAIIIEKPEPCPKMPLLLGEGRIGVTPMGDRLRFSGTLELAGNDLSISPHRVEAIRRKAPAYLPNLDFSEPVEIWRGMRPCTPDGLPMIGRCPAHPRVVLATGHGMLGLTHGPFTGQLVSDIVLEREPEMDLGLVDPGRFS